MALALERAFGGEKAEPEKKADAVPAAVETAETETPDEIVEPETETAEPVKKADAEPVEAEASDSESSEAETSEAEAEKPE
jgi:hypothetical protein